MKKYLQLNDIDCYKRALKLSNYVWDIVVTWDWFAKRSIGTQFVTAIDSISANIAERNSPAYSIYKRKAQGVVNNETMEQCNNGEKVAYATLC